MIKSFNEDCSFCPSTFTALHSALARKRLSEHFHCSQSQKISIRAAICIHPTCERRRLNWYATNERRLKFRQRQVYRHWHIFAFDELETIMIALNSHMQMSWFLTVIGGWIRRLAAAPIQCGETHAEKGQTECTPNNQFHLTASANETEKQYDWLARARGIPFTFGSIEVMLTLTHPIVSNNRCEQLFQFAGKL